MPDIAEEHKGLMCHVPEPKPHTTTAGDRLCDMKSAEKPSNTQEPRQQSNPADSSSRRYLQVPAVRSCGAAYIKEAGTLQSAKSYY